MNVLFVKFKKNKTETVVFIHVITECHETVINIFNPCFDDRKIQKLKKKILTRLKK